MVLSLVLSPANTPDTCLFAAVLDDIPLVATPRGGWRNRPGKVHADKAYDNRGCRAYLRRRGITARIARRAQPGLRVRRVAALGLAASGSASLGAGARSGHAGGNRQRVAWSGGRGELHPPATRPVTLTAARP